jgi:hypothetical protein
MQEKFDRPKYMAAYMKARRARVGIIRRLLASLATGTNMPAAYVQAVEAAQAGGLTRGETVQALTTAKAGALSADIARQVVDLCWVIAEDPGNDRAGLCACARARTN